MKDGKLISVLLLVFLALLIDAGARLIASTKDVAAAMGTAAACAVEQLVDGTVRLQPGRFLIEPVGDGGGDSWIVNYDSVWQVTQIPQRPTE